ncbi:MAG: YmdB family metallophosphoesterase [Candidatus Eremiobacteraeota bacterium]|nr:YmdB family metallophosphoesterase [Candidatus Eremiobacteraeota bacterium]
MRILFFGDVVGPDAVRLLAHRLPAWRQQTRADVVIVNVENACVTQFDDPRTCYGADDAVADVLFAANADVLTGGNHSWDIPLAESLYQRPTVLRPHNMTAPSAGRGVFELQVGDERLAVVNLIGPSALYRPLEARNPLKVFEELRFAAGTVVFVDYHSERILEKRTFAHAIDGRATAVVGTHTHEPTLLLERFPKGTFFCGDAGMCGPSLGVVGMGPEWYVRRMRGGDEPGFTLATGPIQIGALLLDTRASQFERFLP